MENLDALIDFILAEAAQVGFVQKIMGKIRLAAEEVLVNVINYAYPQVIGEVTVTVEETTDKKGLRIEIMDTGIPFDPLAKPAPDLSVPVKQRQIGGLGIYLVKEVMDSVNYKREQGKNILTLIKYMTE